MKLSKLLFILAACFLLTACGYQFEGGGYVNKNIASVSVRSFDNQSLESGAGVVFTSALVNEILQKTDTRVVDEDRSEAVFIGQIKAVTFDILSRSTTESVVEQKIQAVVDLRLVDKEGKTLWSVRDFVAHEAYTVSQDKVADRLGRRAAIEKVAVRCAERLISQTLLDF